MTVTRRSFNAVMNTSGTSASAITVGVPTDVMEGELMLAITSAPTGTPTGTGPDGFELIGSYVSSTLQQSNLYRRIATDSEPANYTWTFTQTSSLGVALITFIGAHDILSFDAQVQTADSTPNTRRIDAARDAVAYSVCCWRDGASSTFTVNQGAEEFDVVSANTGSTIFRGITAAYYGPGVSGLTDIVNIGDALPGTTWTSSGGALDHAINWVILIDNKAPDTEEWSSTNGDFGVELKLDQVELDSLGGIATKFRGDVTGEVTAFFESGENAPNEVTENLADGLTTTKWLAFADTTYVEYDFGASNPKTIKRYRLTSANDQEVRDPHTWTLEGSNNQSDYTVLDSRTDVAFAARGETQEFKVASPGEYRYYKLNIATNRGPTTATSTQLAEFRLSTHDVWEDVTSYVQEEQKIRITRGFQGTSGRHDFSRAYCTFRNTDGRFSTRNQAGAYFGSLQRNTEMRISKAYGTKALQLQGAVRLEGTNMCGDGVRTVLRDDLQITGDIDVRIDLHPESWRDEQMLCGIQTQTSDPLDPTASWSLHLDDNGQINWLHSTGSGTVSYLSTVAVPNIGRQAIRVTVDVDNGASGSTATFYTADSITGEWVRLGDPVTNSGTTSIGYEGGALCVGHVGSKDERGIHGRVFHFELRTGIDGTLVSDVDFTALTNGVHEFEENDNRWVTVNNAVVSNRHYRFHGEVAEWPLYWDTTGSWVEVSATGAGVQKRLERGAMESSSFYRHHTKAIIPDPGAFERHAEPSAYWPCEDLKNTIRIASGLPGKPHMEVYGLPEFESFSDFQGSKALPKLANAKLGGRVTGNSSGYADIRWIMHVPTSITTGSVILQAYGTGNTRRWELEYSGVDQWILRGYDEDDSGTIAWNTGNFAMDTVGEFMYCQMILDQSGINVAVTINAWDEYGTSLGSETDSFLVTTVGRIYRININDDPTNKMNEAYVGHIALYDSADAPDPQAALNAHIYETAVERAKRICDEEEIEFRYIGSSGQAALLGHQDTGAPFGLMTTGAVSDDGYLIDPLDAFGIEYKTNRALYNQAAHLTLDYDAGELSGELRPTEDDSYIVNDFTANRGGAGGARFRRDDGPLSVNPPPDGVAEYAGSQSYSLAHEGQCVQIASWQVHKGTLDEERFPRIEVALENLRIAADSAMIESILTLDVGKRVDITDTPDFLPAEDIRQIVIGYEEWFDNFQHNFKMNTIPERIFEIAEYDSGYAFDTDDAELYEDVNSSTETITVRTNNGPPWTEAPESYPFLLRVDGEVMKAVAPGSVVNTNSGFDENVTGWTGNDSLAWSTAHVHPHPLAKGSALVTPDGVGTFTNIQSSTSEGIPVTEQNDYTASGWVLSPGGHSNFTIFINWRDSGSSLVSTSSSSAVTLVAGEWTYFEVTGTAPATAVTGHVGIQEAGSPAATDEFYCWNLKTQEAHPAYDSSWVGDSFNRADSTTTMGDTDGEGTVRTWREDLGSWGINSNRAYVTASASSYTTITAAADPDEASVEVPVWPSGVAQILFRTTTDGTAENTHCRWGGTVGADAALEFVVATALTRTVTPDINGSDWALAAGDKLSVRCNGSVIECFINDKLALCISETDNQTLTGVGLRTTDTAVRFDNFYVQAAQALQDIQVERGYNGAAAAHKSEAPISLYRSPYRGL